MIEDKLMKINEPSEILKINGPTLVFEDGGVSIYKEGADIKKDMPFIYVSFDVMLELMRQYSFNTITGKNAPLDAPVKRVVNKPSPKWYTGIVAWFNNKNKERS